jgi:hypothetical protein
VQPEELKAKGLKPVVVFVDDANRVTDVMGHDDVGRST